MTEPLTAEHQQWIPITERLPEIEETVLLWLDACKNCGVGALRENGQWYQDNDTEPETMRVTHWRPLPEPPT